MYEHSAAILFNRNFFFRGFEYRVLSVRSGADQIVCRVGGKHKNALLWSSLRALCVSKFCPSTFFTTASDRVLANDICFDSIFKISAIANHHHLDIKAPYHRFRVQREPLNIFHSLRRTLRRCKRYKRLPPHPQIAVCNHIENFTIRFEQTS